MNTLDENLAIDTSTSLPARSPASGHSLPSSDPTPLSPGGGDADTIQLPDKKTPSVAVKTDFESATLDTGNPKQGPGGPVPDIKGHEVSVNQPPYLDRTRIGIPKSRRGKGPGTSHGPVPAARKVPSKSAGTQEVGTKRSAEEAMLDEKEDTRRHKSPHFRE